MVEAFPQSIINAVIQTLGGRVPRPPQVIGQFAQTVNAARQVEMVGDLCMESWHILFSKLAIIPKICKAVLYGIYDLNHNRGYLYVSQSADTAQFAVEMIARWWQTFGQYDFPNAPALLTLCDGGGSNGWRSRLWKLQVQEQLADRLGLEVMVCHYPKNASKWNPIEHRLFGPVSLNWAGKPLRTLETMLAYIRGTTTQTGLQVAAFPVDRVYARGIKVKDEMIQSLNLERHSTCPNWNYTIRPRSLPVCV